MISNPQDPRAPEEIAHALEWIGTARYEDIKALGAGGMGAVYEAFDRERRHPVALKTLLHFSPSALYRFKNEFRALSDVVHPNLVQLYELVVIGDGRVFFTMELVRGTDFITYTMRPEVIEAREAAELVPTSMLPRVRSGSGDEEIVDHFSRPAEPISRPGRTPADIERLRYALRQLVEGVDALHAAGKLHRDIKPSNVLCTPEGRVVLLDFGVATDLAHELDDSMAEREVVGTARYMAPEQATDAPPLAASDWYSVGVMLFQALVGRAPFAGSATEILTHKNAVDPPPPSQCVEGVPEDLDALCSALLHRDPEARPTGREILRWLEQGRASGSLPPPPPANLAARSGIIGREAELGALREAFDAAARGRLVTIRVHGGSGMGKAFLVDSFLDDLVERGEAVTLRGRAYERESVPYKALDSVVDALSRYLTRLADADTPAHLPREIGALARLFPVLRRVDSIAAAPEPGPGSPQAIRRRAIAAMRELLAGLAGRQPIVLYISDAQWGDADSAALLIDLVRPPFDAPLLVILSYREEEADTSAFLVDLRARWPVGAEVRDLALAPLAHADARTLALSRLGSADPKAIEAADSIARESGGNPLLVDELARGVGRTESSVATALTHGAVRLDDLLLARMSRLTDDGLRLLEIVAVSARPVPVTIAGQAAQIHANLEETVSALRDRRFVRRGFRGGQEVVEMVHSRVGAAVVAGLAREKVREHHSRIARALEAAPGADPEALALHLVGAGEKTLAAKYAEQAAALAAAKLAFAQAVRLYELAIASVDDASADARRLRVRLAQTLEAAGRGLQAALAYREAADRAEGFERVELEREAAVQLLTCGQIDAGAAALDRVLRAAGMRAPHSVLEALLWTLAYRLALVVVGLRYREREPVEVRRVDHTRIEALYAVVIGLAFVNAAYGVSAQAREIFLTVRKGDRHQMLRAAAMEATYIASRGGPETPRERELAAIADRLMERTDNADLLAVRDATRCVRQFLRGEWKTALFGLDELYDSYPISRAGWHSNAHLFSLWSLAFLGRMAELRLRHAARLVDAEERGDLYTTVSLRIGHSNAVWLAADEVEEARRHLREAMAAWSHRGFFLQHYRAMLAEASIELYAGDGARAYAVVARDWTDLRRSFLMRIQYLRADAHFLRARCALASASTVADPAARVAEAAQLARKLEAERMRWTQPLAALVRAGVAHARGERDAVIARLREAVTKAEAVDMLMHAASARLRLGSLLGGDEGAELKREALDWMTAQKVRVPERFVAMLAPGLDPTTATAAAGSAPSK